MTPDEVAAALQTAFNQCDAAHVRLNGRQKEILRQAFGVRDENLEKNPLAELTPEERHALLLFVREQESQKQSWKVTLLNDWLQGRDSGTVQSIRDRYGIQWLEQIQTSHLVEYDTLEDGEVVTLKVGDRIEVMNGLWEWVQSDGPCSPEWFPCTVISVQESESNTPGLNPVSTSCIVRFDSGAEYEIQGVYEWNRPNWRWKQVST